MDIARIAEALAAALAPVLPPLLKADGHGAGEGVSEELQNLWEGARPAIEARSAALEAAVDLAQAPEDEDCRGAWRRQVRKILEADPELVPEMARLLDRAGVRIEVKLEGSGASAVGDGAVAAGQGGYAAGRDITTNHYHGVVPANAEGEKTAREVYLRRLIGLTELLPLQGVDPAAAREKAPSLKLHAVYTALRTRSSRHEEDLPQARGETPLSALEQLDRHSRLVLLGDPGSGKSTFLNFVALCLAGEALGLAEANLGRLTLPLPDENGKPTKKPQPWRHGHLLPVRVVLGDFAAKALPASPDERATAKCLWGYLEQEMVAAENAGFYPVLKRELQAGRGLVLLDGLDEVPEAEHRREQIRQAVQDFATTVGTSRLVVTSRTYAYQDPAWRLQGFAEAILAPFSRGQIAGFVGAWYEQQVTVGKMPAGKAEDRAEQLRRAIFTNERLLALAERPLLLTLMASLHVWRGNLPEKREQLYAEAVDLLLSTWENQRERSPSLVEPNLAEWLRVHPQDVRQVLEELAYKAHAAQPEVQGTANVAEGDLVSGLMHLSRNPGANAGQLVAYLRDRSGLLVARGQRVYTFPHRTFQEYLAACHLTGANFPDEVAEFGRKDPGRWREVVLLAGAKAARVAGSTTWSLAEALCDLGRDDPWRSAEDLWGVLLAGQVVAESADLARVGRANEVKLERLRRWLIEVLRAEGFPALERAAAGKTLAKLGDPRFDETRWSLPKDETVGFIEVSEGAFRMGSTKEEDPGAFAAELPQHEVGLPGFWMGRYPVTVGQYRAFLEAAGGEVGDPRSLEGSANHPVVAVSWTEAMAYCRWLGDRLRELAVERRGEGGEMWEGLASGRLRAFLPSEAEWEKAARGSDGRIFPWGREFDPNRANSYETGLGEPSSVGCFPGGASPVGCEEMSGNVDEWTRSIEKAYPYVAGDGRKEFEASALVLRVIRGGAFDFTSRYVRCAARNWHFPDGRLVSVGFRVVLSPFPL